MPRLALKLMKVNDKHLYRTAEAAEVGALAYVTSMDTFGSRLDLMSRCALASVAFYFYSDYVDGMV